MHFTDINKNSDARITDVIDIGEVMPRQCFWDWSVHATSFTSVVDTNNASFSDISIIGYECIAGVTDTGEPPLELWQFLRAF
jgi:hypothetical protein